MTLSDTENYFYMSRTYALRWNLCDLGKEHCFTQAILYHRFFCKDKCIGIQKRWIIWPKNLGNSERAEHHKTGAEYLLYLSFSCKKAALLHSRCEQLQALSFWRFSLLCISWWMNPSFPFFFSFSLFSFLSSSFFPWFSHLEVV